MNMPGFTAENSLYRTSGRYQMTSSTRRVKLSASLLQPSAAIYQDGRFVCYGEVTEEGFINCFDYGGAPGEDPRLAVQCRRACWRLYRGDPTERAECLASC